jgi:4-amino-4-deoxy-L-arabinose transferase-like glycosyltransferase
MEIGNDTAPSSRRVLSRLLTAAGMVGFACILALEVTFAARKLSATWDEPANVLAGLRYWEAGDFGVSSEHPPLAKLVAALPLLRMHLKVPFIGSNVSRPNCAIQGRALVFGDDADAILFRSRLAVGAFALLLIFLLWEAGYSMFGPGVAWLAATLALFEPNLVAYSAQVTSDFGLACLYFAAVYALWRVAERPTAIRLVGCGVALGMALAMKDIGIILIPTLFLLVAVEYVSGARHAGQEGTRRLKRDSVNWTIRLAVIGAVALVVLWGVYRFHYRARPDGLELSPTLAITLLGVTGHVSRPLVTIAARYKLLPEAYLYGLSDVLSTNAHPRIAFLLGSLYPHAFWYYFPVTLLIKSTLGFLALLMVALASPMAWSGKSHRRAAYLLIPPALFLGVSLNSGTNVGVRHVLPVYPFLILAAAAGAWQLAKRRRVWAVVIASLVGFHVVSSLLSLPNYLAYSNELFGGTSRTYRSLSDSNVDWGQGLIEARKYLAQRNIKECWFAYYGSADPAYYQIPCKLLPDPFLWWWGKPALIPPGNFPGVVLISATEMTASEWGPEELNPYAHFFAAEPTAVIGGSILVFEGSVDLRAAAAQAHMTKGWDLHKSGQQELAIQEMLRAEELAPNHPGPPSMLGAIYAEALRTEEARTQLNLALQLAQASDPEFHSIWLDLIKSQLAALD